MYCYDIEQGTRRRHRPVWHRPKSPPTLRPPRAGQPIPHSLDGYEPPRTMNAWAQRAAPHRRPSQEGGTNASFFHHARLPDFIITADALPQALCHRHDAPRCPLRHTAQSRNHFQWKHPGPLIPKMDRANGFFCAWPQAYAQNQSIIAVCGYDTIGHAVQMVSSAYGRGPALPL